MIYINSNKIVYDIHITPFKETEINNNNGLIKLYLKVEKATLINNNRNNKLNIEYRESMTTGEKGYYFIEPLNDLTIKKLDIREKNIETNDFKKITVYESDLKIKDYKQKFKIYTLLLLDLSGSIIREVGPRKSALSTLKKASINFTKQINLNKNKEIAIYGFDGSKDLLPIIDFSNNQNEIIDKINSINSSISKDFSTNLYGAIINGTELIKSKLESNTDNEISIGIIVLFTDGTDRAGRLGPKGYYKVLDTIDNAKKNKEIYFYTIGLGREIDTVKLKSFGTNGFVYSNNINNIIKTFSKAGQTIKDLSNSYYVVEYKTPSRKGAGKVTIMVEILDGPFWGGYRTKFDTSDFNF